jgi:hypothetical protein
VKFAFIWGVTSLDMKTSVRCAPFIFEVEKWSEGGRIWYMNDMEERSRTYFLISVSFVLTLFLCREDKCSLFPRDVPNRKTPDPSSCLLSCGVNMRAYEAQYFNMYFAFLLPCSLSFCFYPYFFHSRTLRQVVGC